MSLEDGSLACQASKPLRDTPLPLAIVSFGLTRDHELEDLGPVVPYYANQALISKRINIFCHGKFFSGEVGAARRFFRLSGSQHPCHRAGPPA